MTLKSRIGTYGFTTLALALGCACLTPAVGAFADGARPAASPADDHHAGSGVAEHTGREIPAPLAAGAVKGLDVSSHQGNVDWGAVAAKGAKFAYVKATESHTYRNPNFGQQYGGSAKAGLIRGAYHFASPEKSSGARQADYFVDHGGGWTADGRTLPGALDVEYNPDQGNDCYGLGKGAMTKWIGDFLERYKQRTGRYPVIYSTTDWWRKCTGNTSAFANKSPLWIANYGGSALPLPSGWSTYTIWQTARSGPLPGDQNVFNGSLNDLKTFAKGRYNPPPVQSWPIAKEGGSGSQVTALQHLLNGHGGAVNVDGAYGPGTKAAVTAFQKSKGLTADGIAGPLTWQALADTLRAGSGGNPVKAAQFLLNGHGAALKVDGQFGQGTKDAVTAFQKSRGLTPDGIVGAQTWQALLG
ncbi:peptidoglycan-binding protein [Streptomyces sp. NA04227]|uniref:GH25 family lysozyme n=1 Tax=Streptomyces sp. NA04227 TaxID=2742136 RepID=UPI001591E1A3|nr:GH25 family lysozyme [Streptomyces sp. NA04227]QKW07938.1 peptidoglycan-binding protein [Streptomyces sp. NA04227]